MMSGPVITGAEFIPSFVTGCKPGRLLPDQQHRGKNGTASVHGISPNNNDRRCIQSRLYTANGPSNDVSVVDTATLSLVTKIPVGQWPWGVAVVER
jgi:YVTN family beta-propeller protein